MKKLDLNAYGVSEMNVAEMRETDGGLIAMLIVPAIRKLAMPVAVIGGIIALEAATAQPLNPH